MYTKIISDEWNSWRHMQLLYWKKMACFTTICHLGIWWAAVKFSTHVFYYKLCLNLLNGGIHKDTEPPPKQSLLHWPCPLPSDQAISVLWQHLVKCLMCALRHTRAPSLTSPGYGLGPATNPNHYCQDSHNHQVSVAPWTPDFFNRVVCSHRPPVTTLSPKLYRLSYRTSKLQVLLQECMFSKRSGFWMY